MNSTQIITTYEEISRTTSKMLIAAQNAEWDELITLEQECRKLTGQLIQNQSEPDLSDELQQKKVKIIHQVLDDDAKIRSITEPWMAKLKDILDTTGRKRSLHQAYLSD